MLKKWIPNWAIPLLLAFAIGTVWLRLQIVGTTYAIHQINLELSQIKIEQERLVVKLSALKSPHRLETLAHTQFKLSKPKMEQIVYLKIKPL